MVFSSVGKMKCLFRMVFGDMWVEHSVPFGKAYFQVAYQFEGVYFLSYVAMFKISGVHLIGTKVGGGVFVCF